MAYIQSSYPTLSEVAEALRPTRGLDGLTTREVCEVLSEAPPIEVIDGRISRLDAGNVYFRIARKRGLIP